MNTRTLRLLALGMLAFALVALFMTQQDLQGLGIVLLIIVLLAAGQRSQGRLDSDGSSEGGLARSVVAVFGVLAATIAAINFIVNPLGIYPETELSQTIVLTSRQDKLMLYRSLDPKPSFLILGSSRSFTLPPRAIEELTGRRAFNASVQGGGPRDYLGFLEFTIEDLSPPAVVLLNLSVEQFLFQGIEDTIEAGEPLGAYVDSPMPNLANPLRAAGLLLSADQTYASFRALESASAAEQSPYFSFDADGQGHFNVRVPLDQAIREYLAGPWAPRIFNVVELSTMQIEYFRSFLHLADENGIYVIVNLPPFHPTALEAYETQSLFAAREAEMMDMLSSLQEEYDFPINDFRQLTSFGGTPEMFNDAVHPSEQAYRRMLHVTIGRGGQ